MSYRRTAKDGETERVKEQNKPITNLPVQLEGKKHGRGKCADFLTELSSHDLQDLTR